MFYRNYLALNGGTQKEGISGITPEDENCFNKLLCMRSVFQTDAALEHDLKY
ncbi:hypothetical protein XNC1_2008 [Xenorhabdus nematophila ATCC 19061]|uniref:Uncharacterized protein n=1 Tax=Xenorhabdus nematophila (strain ATCC 19061 / DSM 3370 / CCUG 14189 / LMG 1036 / NCIMB 9965 / AN6) TaxID=406817 RepID=D3VE01_XENNA|nr:hypothetical protein XNC1_2008 [Xenorhabdus nematophila ATCC 19061]